MTRTAWIVFLSMLLLAALSGCATTDGGSSGWIVIGDTNGSTQQPPPATRKAPEGHPGKGKGLEVAARNHIRSAYRFLEKGKPDHAMRELEKGRSKMGRNYWYHYYMGGSYFMKAMYGDARDSWERAYSSTRDRNLRSRALTCQSFAVYWTGEEDPSLGFLRKAVELDDENHTARTLMDDLIEGRQEDGDSAAGRKPGKGKGKKKKKEQEKSQKGKGSGKKRKIGDEGQFADYFLIEMP